MNIERSTRRPRQIGLTPLIDVVFLLIIFFMLSTSFIRTESMELSFPKGKDVASAKDTVIRVYIADDRRVFLGMKEVDIVALKTELRLALLENPDRAILLLGREGVTTQRLIGVMDDIYIMGGKNVAVGEWKEGMPGPVVQPLPEEEIEAESLKVLEGAAD